MRVAILLHEDFPGSDNRVQRECRSLLDAGHDVTVFCSRGESSETEWRGARIVRSSVRRFKSGSTARRAYDYVAFPLSARRWLARTGSEFDVVQAANPPDWLVLAGLGWRRRAHGRLVLDIHDPMPELHLARGGGRWMARALRLLERISCRAADAVIVTTEPIQRRIHEATGVTAVHVPNGVDRERFPLAEPTSAVFSAVPLRVVYHGTVQDRFGVDVAVEAVKILVSEGQAVHLDVYGDGVGMARVRAALVGVPDSTVTLHGQVPSVQLSERLRGAAIGLVPYRDSAFMRLVESSKALEYASMGIAVIGSDLAPLRSQLGDNGAEYVLPGDAESLAAGIRRLMTDPSRALANARAAQEHVGDDDWDARAHHYLSAVTGGAVGRP